jgi:hypothetical protein
MSQLPGISAAEVGKRYQDAMDPELLNKNLQHQALLLLPHSHCRIEHLFYSSHIFWEKVPSTYFTYF